MNFITVEVPVADMLTIGRFTFSMVNFILTLDGYAELYRETKRHKFVVVRCWQRIDNSESTMARYQVPYTPEVGNLAKESYCNKITVEHFWRKR